MARAKVLVVEDDLDIRELVRELLERAGFQVHGAEGGREALRLAYGVRPDLVVLDLGLPDLDGWEVLARLRDVSDVPVLVLTAQSEELQTVRALREGADDYVVKPFGRQALVARCEALVRRGGRTAGEEEPVLDDGCVLLDPARHHASAGGTPLDLTPLEFRLLHALVSHRGRVLAPEQLLELCWGDTSGTGRDRVKTYVAYLRRKLEQSGQDPIETVRGIGYRYRPPAA